jgi:ubiquinone/menaquinone biosynthesis C-methylase UbiE
MLEGGVPEERANPPDLIRNTYDRVATAYAREFLTELERKPLDRALLKTFVEDVGRRGPVLDLATGPGHVARFLHEAGVSVTGLDIAPGMVAAANEAHPGVAFRVGDLSVLDVASDSLGGITCFYGIVHLRRAQLSAVFAEWHRALAPGGIVLLSFHVGQETVQPLDFLGEKTQLAWNLFASEEVAGALEVGGLPVEAVLERMPYPGEHPSKRGYLIARRTG